MPLDFLKIIENSCSLFIEKKNGAQITQSALKILKCNIILIFNYRRK